MKEGMVPLCWLFSMYAHPTVLLCDMHRQSTQVLGDLFFYHISKNQIKRTKIRPLLRSTWFITSRSSWVNDRVESNGSGSCGVRVLNLDLGSILILLWLFLMLRQTMREDRIVSKE